MLNKQKLMNTIKKFGNVKKVNKIKSKIMIAI